MIAAGPTAGPSAYSIDLTPPPCDAATTAVAISAPRVFSVAVGEIVLRTRGFAFPQVQPVPCG